MDATCATCRVPFDAKRPTARFCSSACRQKAQRRRDAGVPESPTPLEPVTVLPTAPGSVYAATLTELEAAERASTALGAAALALAARIDMAQDTGSALASAVKTLGETLSAATKGAQVAHTRLDEVRARRDAKRGA